MIIARKKQFLIPLVIALIALVFTVGLFILKQREADAAVTGWEAGNIMDDAIMANKSTMSVKKIQSFLNSKVPTCDTYGKQISEFSGGKDYNGDGKITRAEWGRYKYGQTKFICLKNATQGGKSAAQIIYNVAQKYTINPQVLIVLLQKEQGLVTDTWPLNSQYRSATGYGCPDTAPCDSDYYGLTNQLEWAAKMFRAILNNSPSWYTPFELGNNYIQYNPTASCGGSNVYIENRATQALYSYTPYQPNKATLKAGWGTASCGAYGNRNFKLYFNEWFGSLHYTTQGAIGNKYNATGGREGSLGAPLSNEKPLNSGGVWQQFEHGRIYWKSQKGAWIIAGGIGNKYVVTGGSSSGLGYPIGDETALSTGGVTQQFERGHIYWKPNKGTWVVAGGVGSKYIALGADNGALGYPLSDEKTSSGGVYQQYENGRIYWKSGLGGAWTLTGDMLTYYLSNSSSLGHPTSDSKTNGSDTYQSFERAVLYKTPTNTRIVNGAIDNKYRSVSGVTGTLGAPQGNEIPLSTGGVYQQFEHGRIYWKSKKGTWVVAGDMLSLYLAKNADESTFGYPISDSKSFGSGSVYQKFEGGALYKTSSNSYSTQSAIGGKYTSTGGIGGPLGAPTSNENSLSTGGVYQQFEKGRIYWKSKKGTWVVAGGIGNKYIALGADTSTLGYPLSDEITFSTGVYQLYENGRIYWKSHIGATVTYN